MEDLPEVQTEVPVDTTDAPDSGDASLHCRMYENEFPEVIYLFSCEYLLPMQSFPEQCSQLT